jgi:microsomal dipeptidase-like Zn-dependent dipeptidase
LSKNLARAQIEAIKARGGSMDTVAGQQLQAEALGKYTYPPQALIDITQRNFADLKDLELQAQAIQKFQALHGEANTKSFQSDWAKNSDNKVFQAMSINEQIQDPIQKKNAIDELLGAKPQASQYKSTDQYNNALNAWKNQRATFVKKYDNIQKLVNTGTLR